MIGELLHARVTFNDGQTETIEFAPKHKPLIIEREERDLMNALNTSNVAGRKVVKIHIFRN